MLKAPVRKVVWGPFSRSALCQEPAFSFMRAVVSGLTENKEHKSRMRYRLPLLIAISRNAEALKGEHKESFIGDVHGTLAKITLILVGLHILGVLLASFVHHENLVAAMITGKKRREDVL